jgi:hypothetical protein
MWRNVADVEDQDHTDRGTRYAIPGDQLILQSGT